MRQKRAITLASYSHAMPCMGERGTAVVEYALASSAPPKLYAAPHVVVIALQFLGETIGHPSSLCKSDLQDHATTFRECTDGSTLCVCLTDIGLLTSVALRGSNTGARCPKRLESAKLISSVLDAQRWSCRSENMLRTSVMTRARNYCVVAGDLVIDRKMPPKLRREGTTASSRLQRLR
jgi:hypothetical protein